MKTLPSIFLIIAFLHPLGAAEITGIVQSGGDQNATVRVNGDLVPALGDKAEIFFKLDGVEGDISVATGSVLKVEGDSIQVKIEKATGEVAKDQLVRISSAKPEKRGSMPANEKTAEPPRRGKLLLSMDFESGPGAVDGERPVVAKIPADQNYTVPLGPGDFGDFFAECVIRVGEVQRGRYCGLIFRAQVSDSGHFKHYEAVTLQTDPPILQFWCRWTKAAGDAKTQELRIPADLIEPLRNRIGVEAAGETIRVFINNRFAGAFTNDRVTPAGLIGFSVHGGDPERESAAYFDDFQIYELASPDATLPPVQPPSSTPSVTSAAFAGQWKVQNEQAAYVLSLRQEENHVFGSYNLEGGSLVGFDIKGTLHATWKQPGNRRGGVAKLQLSADGETLSGTWEYDPETFSSGLKGGGIWTFKRISRSP